MACAGSRPPFFIKCRGEDRPQRGKSFFKATESPVPAGITGDR